MIRRPSGLLAAAFALALSGPAGALDLDRMSAAERSAFGDAVRDYLMENPAVLVEALQAFEEQQQQAQINADFDLVSENAEALFSDGYSWIGGNPDGDITLVEFLDYRCGYCRKAHGEVSALLEADDNIRLIIKEFPILGDASTITSRFAIATRMEAGDDAYKQVHDALIEMSGDPTPVALRRLAEEYDLDADAIIARMPTQDVTNEISANHALAQRLMIRGTPTFVLEDEMLRGYLPFDQMQQIVAQKRG